MDTFVSMINEICGGAGGALASNPASQQMDAQANRNQAIHLDIIKDAFGALSTFSEYCDPHPSARAEIKSMIQLAIREIWEYIKRQFVSIQS